MPKFVPPMPGEPQIYICLKCKNRFSAKTPKLGILGIKKTVPCPVCKGRSIPDPAIRY